MDDQQVKDGQEVADEVLSQDGFPTLEDVKETVQDGEIVATEDNTTLLTSLDDMIQSHVKSIDRLKTEIKKLREMVQDGFNNDAVYKEHDAAVKAATKIKQATKAQIMKQPAVLELVQKMKTLSSELKDKNFSLSDYLLEYQRLSGANQIETDDGQVLEIVNSAKIVRKSK